MDDKVSNLLTWSLHNGVDIDPAVHLTVDGPSTGVAVFSKQSISSDTTIVRISDKAILSLRSSSLADRIPFVPYGHDGHLALSTALYFEILEGSASKWHGYLQSLPSLPVPIALFWGLDIAFLDDEDGKEAKLWLQGTEVAKELRGDSGIALMEEVQAYYSSVVLPLMSELGRPSTLYGYLHAYSLVSSRAFIVNAYHGISMVPIADAFNHSSEHHVRLETETDVCPICGSLTECAHDREDDSAGSPTSENPSTQSSFSDSLNRSISEMVAIRPIQPNTEIYNTYGSRLGNSTLLARYGFMLDGNENDIISWDLSEHDLLADGCGEPPLYVSASEFAELYRKLVKAWLRSMSSIPADSSALFYRPIVEEGEGMKYVGWQSLLCINSDAQISIQLWLYAALWSIVTLSRDTQLIDEQLPDMQSVSELILFLGRVIDEQLQIEMAMDSEEEYICPLEKSEMLATVVLRGIAETISSLCTRRLARMGKRPELSTGELGDLLDGLAEDRTKTRLALMEVIAERSILESCYATWREFQDELVGRYKS